MWRPGRHLGRKLGEGRPVLGTSAVLGRLLLRCGVRQVRLLLRCARTVSTTTRAACTASSSSPAARNSRHAGTVRHRVLLLRAERSAQPVQSRDRRIRLLRPGMHHTRVLPLLLLLLLLRWLWASTQPSQPRVLLWVLLRLTVVSLVQLLLRLRRQMGGLLRRMRRSKASRNDATAAGRLLLGRTELMQACGYLATAHEMLPVASARVQLVLVVHVLRRPGRMLLHCGGGRPIRTVRGLCRVVLEFCC